MILKRNDRALYFLVIIILVIIINLLLISRNKVKQNLISEFKVEYEKIVIENSTLMDLIINQLDEKTVFQDLSINYLTNILPPTHKNLLVLRFSENYCSPCIEMALSNIKKYSDYIGSSSIVFMFTTNSLKSFITGFKDRNLENYRLINVSDSEFNLLGKNKKDRPFYFIIDSQGTAKCIFEPILMIPNLTDKYFKMISTLFFSSK